MKGKRLKNWTISISDEGFQVLFIVTYQSKFSFAEKLKLRRLPFARLLCPKLIDDFPVQKHRRRTAAVEVHRVRSAEFDEQRGEFV